MYPNRRCFCMCNSITNSDIYIHLLPNTKWNCHICSHNIKEAARIPQVGDWWCKFWLEYGRWPSGILHSRNKKQNVSHNKKQDGTTGCTYRNCHERVEASTTGKAENTAHCGKAWWPAGWSPRLFVRRSRWKFSVWSCNSNRASMIVRKLSMTVWM